MRDYDPRRNPDRYHDMRKAGEIDRDGHYTREIIDPPPDPVEPDPWESWREYLRTVAIELGCDVEDLGMMTHPLPRRPRGSR